MTTPAKYDLLLVDDEADYLTVLQASLGSEQYHLSIASDGVEAINLLQKQAFDLVLLDVRMPKVDGLEVLEFVKNTTPDTEVIMLSGVQEVSIAVECIQKGAFTYLSKPINKKELNAVIRHALDKRLLTLENKLLRTTRPSAPRDQTIIGESPAMHEVLAVARKIAPTNSPVLIQGGSGTGKELVAKLLYENSGRADSPFISLNCAAIPETLIESELFGHTKGAFTDAKETKTGLVDLAHRGTLFLDEIGEVSPSVQPKLLRFLQFGEYRRVGGKEQLHADVRVISATNRNLQQDVRDGRFREDLLYRINVITLDIPPLRDRKEDIPHLVHHFIRLYGGTKESVTIEDGAIDMLRGHDWPGNIRELENVMQRAIILADEGRIQQRHVRISRQDGGPQHAPEDGIIGQAIPLEVVEKQHIAGVLKNVGWNKKVAAGILGISLKTLYTKISKYQLAESA